MHYLFERRLNMLDIAINDLSDEALKKEATATELLKDYHIEIPELQTEKVKYEIKKEKLTTDNAPEAFHNQHGHEYDFLSCTFPFSSTEFIDDILKMTSKDEGLTIKPKEIVYKEFSHHKIETHNAEYERIKANAHKAIAPVSMLLDEFAADAVEFNQLQLPAAISEKLSAEKLRRVLQPSEKNS